MKKSTKRTVFFSVVTVLATDIGFSRSLSATEYPYPTVDESDIDNRGLPCYMQTEDGSTLDLSRVCIQPKPKGSPDEVAPPEMMDEPDRFDDSYYESPYSPEPDSTDEPYPEDEIRY
ncbi:MAG: hypothetical protein LDL41_10375 [Coleofasciculus sp. S288]|nr:hypothetical protein [Coleofasciculus sp. S288]